MTSAVLAAASTDNSAAGTGFLIAAGFIAYWVPAIIALIRHVPAKGQVVMVNLFLGWTVIGWIVALAMAFRARPETPAVTR